MTLKFYYRTHCDGGDPLIATAFIPAHGNQSFPWPEGKIEFYQVDLENLPGDDVQWRRRDNHFRSSLREELKEYIVVTNREPLKPWTRLAFEKIHQYGIPGYYPFVYAKLFEDDGTEFDPANAIPLYGANPGPVREPFRTPGLTTEQIAADEAAFAEIGEMLLQRKLARQQNNPEKLAEIEEMFRQRAAALEPPDEAKLLEIREWFQSGKRARDQKRDQS